MTVIIVFRCSSIFLKDPTYAIFLKSWGFKDVKYDIPIRYFHSTCLHNAKKHYFKADSESKTCGNPTKDQRADHLSANASNFKPTRDFIKVHDIEHTHQNWLMDKWDPADVVETFDNVLVSIAVNQNFLSEKGGPLERIITERGNNFAVQFHVSTFIKLYFAAPRFRC